MPRQHKKQDDLETLRELSVSPLEQRAYAAKLLGARKNAVTVTHALRTLSDLPPDLALRQLILDIYAYYDEDGVKRDAGSAVRAAALQALDPIAHPDDLPLLERAMFTYERIPPYFTEEAGLLRAAGLVVTAQLAPQLAAYHAARLLSEPIEVLAGEPHLTAIKVLAGQNMYVPIYTYAAQTTIGKAEPLGEALRRLVEIPPTLVRGLYEKYRETPSDIVLVGLYDLLIGHAESRQFTSYIADFLTNTANIPALQYVATAVLASRRDDLIELVTNTYKQALSANADPRRLAALKEPLTLLATHPLVAPLLKPSKATPQN